jgi:hypothetical protein
MSGQSQVLAPAPSPSLSTEDIYKSQDDEPLPAGMLTPSITPGPPEHGKAYLAARELVHSVQEKCETKINSPIDGVTIPIGRLAQLIPAVGAVCAAADVVDSLDKAKDFHAQGDKEGTAHGLADAGKSVLSKIGGRYANAAASLVDAARTTQLDSPVEGAGVSDHLKSAVVRAAGAAIGGGRFSEVAEPAMNAGLHAASGKREAALQDIRDVGVKGAGAVAGGLAQKAMARELAELVDIKAQAVANNFIPQVPKSDKNAPVIADSKDSIQPKAVPAPEGITEPLAKDKSAETALVTAPSAAAPRMPSLSFMNSLTASSLQASKRSPSYPSPGSPY